MAKIYPYSGNLQGLLANPPAIGQGRHNWLWRVALSAKGCGWRPDAISRLLNKVCVAGGWADRMGRNLDDIVAKISDDYVAPDSARLPDWPEENEVARLAMAETPPLFSGDPIGVSAGEAINCMFAPNDIVCFGYSMTQYGAMLAPTLARKCHKAEFIVANPMRLPCDERGRVRNKQTAGTLESRRYCVVEFDQGEPRHVQAAILSGLSGPAHPLRCAVWSGGKSIHGWFDVSRLTARQKLKFFRYAVYLGADSSLWDMAKLVRMPGGVRKNGASQDVLYRNEETIDMDFNEIALSIKDPLFLEQEAKANPDPYTVRSFGHMAAMDLPPQETFLGGVFALGSAVAVIGPGGVGKSKAVLGMARNNVLGLKWCGLHTGDRPMRWLFIGNENSPHRMNADTIAMSKGLNDLQKELLSENIYLHSLETLDDSYISIGDPSCRIKLQETCRDIVPDVLVVDPWNEVSYGDANSDGDIRGSLRDLVRTARHANPQCAVVIIHHSRTGRVNLSQAVGFDKSNFGKGSKALYSGVRAQINMAPQDPDDHTKIVVSCAKANDSAPFSTVGGILDIETMTYSEDLEFDEATWMMDVEGKRSPGARVVPQDVVDAAQELVTRKDLIERLIEDTGAGQSTVYRIVSKAEKDGLIGPREFKGRKYLQTTGEIAPRFDTQSVDSEEDTPF